MKTTLRFLPGFSLGKWFGYLSAVWLFSLPFSLKAQQSMLPAAFLSANSPSNNFRPSVRDFLLYNGTNAAAPTHLPRSIHAAVGAANRLQGKPYVWGGGHRYLHDRGYDCSGAVSFVLYHAGLLRGPLTSSQFKNYGVPGPGRFITIYTKGGEHVFIAICGLRFDTSDHGAGRGDGPRWRPTARSFKGYQMRHPPGM